PVRRRGDTPVARGAARGGDRLAGSLPARGLRPAPGNLRAAVFLTPRPPYQAQLGQRRGSAQAALSRCCAGLLSPGDPKDSTVRGEFGASATLDELRPIWDRNSSNPPAEGNGALRARNVPNSPPSFVAQYSTVTCSEGVTLLR